MPVANEENTMAELIERILNLPLDNLYLYTIIDDYSKDNTKNIIQFYEENTDKVKCIYFEKSTGVISCYFEGYRQALADGADYILEMDGGMSHQPSEIPRFIEKLEQGYDCVWGSRFINGGGISSHAWYRRFLSRWGTYLANIVLGTQLKDMTSGFEGFQRAVLEQYDFSKFLSTGHMYQTEMRYYCRNCKAAEVPIHYIGGNTSLKLASVTEALRILFQLKKNENYVRITS